MSVVVHNAEDIRALVGEEIGTSTWVEVTQDRIDGFADLTGDHQWIHTEPERAASGPFGTTIAHGYLTLSLLILSSKKSSSWRIERRRSTTVSTR